MIRDGIFAKKRYAPPLSGLLKIDFFALMAIFFVFYFYKLSNYSLLIDDEAATFRSSALAWLGQGRWGAYLFESWILPNPAIPFMSSFMFGVFMALAYLVLLTAHDVMRAGFLHYLTYPIFVAFPIWIFLAGFAANFAASGLAMLLACVSVKFYRDSFFINTNASKFTRARKFLLATFFCSCAVGVYQSYIFVVAVLAAGLLLNHSAREDSGPKALFFASVMLLLFLALGVVIYKAIDFIFSVYYVVERSGYISQFLDFSRFSSSPASAVLIAGESFRNIYGGSAKYFAVPIYGVPFIMLSGALAVCVGWGRGKKVFAIVLLFAISCAPFWMDLFSGGMPLRTLIAVPAVIWFFAMLGLTSEVRWISWLAISSVLFALFGTLHSINTIQAVDAYVKNNDRMLAADIYRRIAEVNNDFDRRKTYLVDIFGSKEFVSVYPRPASSTWGYSFFEWDNGNPDYRMLVLMRILGYDNLQLVPLEKRFNNVEYFQKMPIWPARNSVQVIDGVTLVRLGADLGYPLKK